MHGRRILRVSRTPGADRRLRGRLLVRDRLGGGAGGRVPDAVLLSAGVAGARAVPHGLPVRDHAHVGAHHLPERLLCGLDRPHGAERHVVRFVASRVGESEGERERLGHGRKGERERERQRA